MISLFSNLMIPLIHILINFFADHESKSFQIMLKFLLKVSMPKDKRKWPFCCDYKSMDNF